MKSADTVGTTFINTVIGRGILNGVINLSFGVFNFTPDDNGRVDLDAVVACRLRMDKICATQLRDTLNDLLAAIAEAERTPDEPKVEGLAVIEKQPREKMN